MPTAEKRGTSWRGIAFMSGRKIAAGTWPTEAEALESARAIESGNRPAEADYLTVSELSVLAGIQPRQLCKWLRIRPSFPAAGSVTGLAGKRWVRNEVRRWFNSHPDGRCSPVRPRAAAKPSQLEDFFRLDVPLHGGVYILMLGTVVQYVGQAKNLWLRIAQHTEAKSFRYDRCYIRRVDDQRERIALERKMIRELHPRINIVHVTKA